MTKFVPSAAAFIHRERSYLASHSNEAGRRFVADIASVIRLLDEHPEAGTELTLLKERRWTASGAG